MVWTLESALAALGRGFKIKGQRILVASEATWSELQFGAVDFLVQHYDFEIA